VVSRTRHARGDREPGGGGLASAGSSGQKATKVTLQLKWVTQAQFAGFYAAKAKGFYSQAGLDVNLKVGGPDISPEQVVAGKQASSASTGSRACSLSGIPERIW